MPFTIKVRTIPSGFLPKTLKALIQSGADRIYKENLFPGHLETGSPEIG